MRTQLDKWGNSLALKIPGDISKKLGFTAGMSLEISVHDGGFFVRQKRAKYSLEELVSQITPENVHGETDWGPAVGRETW